MAGLIDAVLQWLGPYTTHPRATSLHALVHVCFCVPTCVLCFVRAHEYLFAHTKISNERVWQSSFVCHIPVCAVMVPSMVMNEQKAATIIQANFRGFASRKKGEKKRVKRLSLYQKQHECMTQDFWPQRRAPSRRSLLSPSCNTPSKTG